MKLAKNDIFIRYFLYYICVCYIYTYVPFLSIFLLFPLYNARNSFKCSQLFWSTTPRWTVLRQFTFRRNDHHLVEIKIVVVVDRLCSEHRL